MEDFQQKEQSLSRELEHGRQRSEEVNQELGEVLEELRTAGLESHESRRQLRRKEILEKMHRRHPQGVVSSGTRRSRTQDELISSTVKCSSCCSEG